MNHPGARQPGWRFLLLGFLLAAGQCCAPGCAWSRWGQRGEDTAFGRKVPCRLPPDATVEDYVEHVNQNVDRLQGWRASGAKLRANNMPQLDALIAVEKDNRLRIIVSSFTGNEVDLGSNDEVFWFWAKRQQPAAVMYAKHEQLDQIRESLRIPFEPSLLMEAFGVAPLSPQGMELEQLPDKKSARLVSFITLPNGRQLRKSITIDTCHGRVLEHSVYDSSDQLIAQASFFDHRIDAETGIVMPHHVRLKWPQANMTLAMDLGKIEVNPTGLPARTWELPHMPEYPLVNLEEVMRREQSHAPRRRSPAGRAMPASHQTADDDWGTRRISSQEIPTDDAEAENAE